MSLRTRFLRIRLVLEGIEVPVVAVTVTGSANSAATASIQIVPTPSATRVPNRSLVHVFFRDLHEGTPGRVGFGSEGSEQMLVRQAMAPVVPETPDEQVVREAAGGETLDTLDIPEELLRYRLLFVGEVVSLTFQNSPTGRVVVLQCAGLSSYWDMIAADRKGGNLFGTGMRTRGSGYTPAPFWDLIAGSTGAVFEKLTEPPASFPNLRGFSAGLIHLLEELMGVSHRRGPSGTIIAGRNQFMTMAGLRLRLLQTIGVTGGDDTPLKLLRRQGFGSIWRVALRGLPRYFSYRHLINALMPYTFYETVPVLAPHYVPPTGIYASYANWAGFSTGFLRNSPQWAWLVRLADRIASTARGPIAGDLADIGALVDEQGSAEPSEFPFLLEELKDRGASMKLLARRIVEGVTGTRASTAYERQAESGRYERYAYDAAERAALDTWSDEQLVSEGYRRVPALDRQAMRRLEPVRSNAQGIERRCGELVGRLGRTSLPARPDPRVQQLLSEIAQLATDIGEYSMPPPRRGDDDDDSEPSHLYCDIFRPDVWFCAPPRCNVLFPDSKLSVNYSRIFGQEPTRLMIRMYDKWLGSDPLFDKWWIAPVASGLFSNRPVGVSGAARRRVQYDLMDHELMGGIVPVFHTMSDREMYLGARVTGYGAQRPDQSPSTQEDKEYFQQVTNFLLFRARFGARTLTVNGPFNPYLALGFPALLVDSPPNKRATDLNQVLLATATTILSKLDEPESSAVLELLRSRTGVHFLGTIQQLTHTASAMGESCGTDISMGYAREHNERIEFMGQDLMRLANAVGSETQTLRRHSAVTEAKITELRAYLELLEVEGAAGMSGQIYTSGVAGAEPVLELAPGRESMGAPRVMMHDEVVGNTRALLEQYESLPRRVVTLPTRRTSLAFALDAPRARVGTPPEEGGDLGDYHAGNLGPHGGEILEVEDVTDQYQNARCGTNVSGHTAAEAERAQTVLDQLERDLQESQQRVRPEMADTDADSSVDWNEDDTYEEGLRQQIAARRDVLGEYARGARTVMLTLPFISTGRTGRGAPVTVISTDRVGVPTDIRDIPQLVGVLGSADPRAVASIVLRVFRVTEDRGRSAGEVFDLGAEDVLRPPWYGQVWSNALIGGSVYLPFFGIGSIVDPVTILRPEAVDVFGLSGQDLRSEVAALNTAVQHDDVQDGPVMAGILEGATIENAVDFLVHTYALTRQSGYDVDAFIRNYTWRPVASMFDLFGSGDLVLDSDGDRAVSGVEGFHSRAFGPHSNLFGLLPYSNIQSLLGIDEDDVATAARVDVRARRFALIQAYRLELLHMRGCATG